MTNKKESLADKLRNSINERLQRPAARTFTTEEELLQVDSWIEMPAYFQKAVGGKGFPCGHITQIVGESDTGKCLGLDTKLIKSDGSIVKVQDVVVGDQLMGPDSKPRTVLALGRGREEMFKITPNKGGESFTCNRSHILSLKTHYGKSGYTSNTPYNVSVHEYLSLNPTLQRSMKLWRSAIDFEQKPVPYDPYWVGLWLGDGAVGTTRICKDEPELDEYFLAFAEQHKFTITTSPTINKCKTTSFVGVKGLDNPLLNFCRDALYINEEKRIPIEYMTNARPERLRLLAGLLDTDGHLDSQRRTGFEISTKYQGLNDDILFLARSLGFQASSTIKMVKLDGWESARPYHRIHISGKCSQIPTKIARKQAKDSDINRDHQTTGFTIESLGEGDYYGFQLDGDRLYLLADTTVTHNTTLLMEAMVSTQKAGGQCFLIDTEHKFSFKRYTEMGGISEEITVISVNSLEEAWNAIHAVIAEVTEIRKANPDLPVFLAWDSVAASVPDALLEAESEAHHVSVEAKINNKEVRKARQAIRRSNIAAAFINHTYMDMPKFGIAKEILKGGKEMFYLSTLIIKVKRRAWLDRIVGGLNVRYGSHSLLEVFKGHLGGEKTTTEFWVVGRGILGSKAELDAYKAEL